MLRTTLPKLFAVVAMFPVLAMADCNSKDIMELGKTAFLPIVKSDLNASDGLFPFRGQLQAKNCSGMYCSLDFKVIDVVYDDMAELYRKKFEIDVPPIEQITTSGKIDFLPIESLVVGSEWLVTVTSFVISRPSSNAPLTPRCVEWLAEIRNNQVIYHRGKLRLPYSAAKAKLLEPLTSDGGAAVERAFDDLFQTLCQQILQVDEASTDPELHRACAKARAGK